MQWTSRARRSEGSCSRARFARLGEVERDLVALRFGADMTARQIADILGMQTNAVEVALHRALGRLRDALGENPDAGGTALPAVRDEVG